MALLFKDAFINGAWEGAKDRFAVTNPATGEELAQVASCTAEQTEKAIAAADKALPAWRSKTAKERAAILRRWYELMMQHQDALAELLTREQGKPLAEAKGEIAYAAAFLEWFGEEAKRVYGETIPAHQPDMDIIVTKEPVGVCAIITPWNFPAAMITRKLGAALAAGCTAVVKPASATPLSALALAHLAAEAGVPDGVLNIVTGKASVIGKVLTGSDTVRKLSFTGSTDTGRKLAEASAPTLKKLSMELGGNAPFIVFDDADMDAAVEGAMASKYRNAGQTCVCANRIYVQDGVYDAFVEKLTAATRKLTLGNGLDKGVEQGPLIDADAVEKVEELLADAVAKGAVVKTGGERHKLGGTFFTPTVLCDVPDTARMAKEEIFGPVAAVYRFVTEDEAIAKANDTEFGLASYFYARDIGRILRVRDGLEYGMVGINTGMISTEVAPFGGVKQSGYGREGSRYGIEEYVQVKYSCIKR